MGRDLWSHSCCSSWTLRNHCRYHSQRCQSRCSSCKLISRNDPRNIILRILAFEYLRTIRGDLQPYHRCSPSDRRSIDRCCSCENVCVSTVDSHDQHSIDPFSIDIADQSEVCRAFKETFHSCGIRVPATLVQVNAFVHPEMRVEIEADAIVL